MAMSTCRDCNRIVLMVRLSGSLVATDPELIHVVPAQHVGGSGGGSVRMGTATTPARRLHSERCHDYQDEGRKKRLRLEMAEFTKQNGQTARQPRRNRGL